MVHRRRQWVALLMVMLLGLSLMPGSGTAAKTAKAEQQASVQQVDPTPTPGVKSCFELDLSTGTSTPFVTDSYGTLDPDWVMTVSPDPSMTTPGPVYSIDPHPAWFTATGANWVDPYNSGYGGGATPQKDAVGDYVFVNNFTLNGALYYNFQLTVDLYAGDDKVELFLDGVSLGAPTSYSAPPGGPVSVPVGPGAHVLEARVYNAMAWMGLLVRGRVTADCRPDLTIAKKTMGEMIAGQNGSYQLVVTNVGAGPTVGPITVVDTLPGAFVSAGGAGWTCTNSGSTVTCQHPGPLGPGQSLPPITVTMQVPFGVPGVSNCASVETAQDMNAQNNRDCVKSEVMPPKPGAICGVKFNDLNGNGVRDTGEPTMAGWTIQLVDGANNVVATVVTGADGTYCFKQLKPGSYTVSEVNQPGWVQTAPAFPGTWSVLVGSGQVLTDISFGNRKPKPKPCCLTFRFNAGRPDKFATTDGPEPASPSNGLLAALSGATFTGFDEPGTDKVFAHTFVLPQGNCISRARLTIRVKPNGAQGSLVENDAMTLRFSSPSGPPIPGTPVWTSYFGSGNPNPGLLPNQWHSGNYGPTTFNLNLASLPGPVNMIAALNAQRFLDVYVQDDTAVDYMVLTVEFCECDQSKEHDQGHGNPNSAKSEDLPSGYDQFLIDETY